MRLEQGVSCCAVEGGGTSIYRVSSQAPQWQKPQKHIWMTVRKCVIGHPDGRPYLIHLSRRLAAAVHAEEARHRGTRVSTPQPACGLRHTAATTCRHTAVSVIITRSSYAFALMACSSHRRRSFQMIHQPHKHPLLRCSTDDAACRTLPLCAAWSASVSAAMRSVAICSCWPATS